jgi:hypothetical protein
MLVLDLGKSIKEMEELCLGKGIKVLKADGDDKKIRAESVYTEEGLKCPRWLLLPGSDHGVLPGSRNKTYPDQLKHMAENYEQYSVGSARELIQIVTLKYFQDGTFLFSKSSETYGRCKEVYQLNNGQGSQITLGGVVDLSDHDGGILVHNTSLMSVIAHTIRGLIAFADF